LAVADFQVDKRVQPILVAASGDGLTIGDPQAGRMRFNGVVTSATGDTLKEGFAVAAERRYVYDPQAGQDGDRNLVFMAGRVDPAGSAPAVAALAIIDAAGLDQPRMLSYVPLTEPGTIVDIVLQGELAIVGRSDGRAEMV